MSCSANEGFARATCSCLRSTADPTVGEISDIKTAVSEAVTNCIIHAYRDVIGMIYISVKIFENGKVVIRIRDKGCGIEDIEKAKEPLYSTGGRRTRRSWLYGNGKFPHGPNESDFQSGQRNRCSITKKRLNANRQRVPMDNRKTKISDNIGLVHACAKRFKSRGIEYDDLFQAGCLGLVKAVDGFDDDRGVKFSTYAVPVILGEMKRLFRDGGAVKVGRALKGVVFKSDKSYGRFYCKGRQSSHSTRTG